MCPGFVEEDVVVVKLRLLHVLLLLLLPLLTEQLATSVLRQKIRQLLVIRRIRRVVRLLEVDQEPAVGVFNLVEKRINIKTSGRLKVPFSKLK